MPRAAGVPVPDPLRTYGVSKATFFKWRSKYASLFVSRQSASRQHERPHTFLAQGVELDLALSDLHVLRDQNPAPSACGGTHSVSPATFVVAGLEVSAEGGGVDRYNIINEQELLEAGDQLVAYLAQHAQATPRGRAHPASPRTAPPLRLVRRTTA